MSDVFREVDEEVRRDRASDLWKRYGGLFTALALVIVVGIGGWRLWDYWQDQEAAALGDRYAAAITLAEAGDADGAQAAFAAIAADGSGGYPILARLSAAAEQAKAGDIEGAAATYRAVASEADGPMADLARLRAAYLMVGRDSTDAVMAVLGRTVDEGNAFSLSAQEVLGLEAWGREDLDVANTHFLAIVSAPNPPTGLRSRAEIMLDLIAGSGGTAPSVAPLPAPPPAFETPTLTAPAQTTPTETTPDAATGGTVLVPLGDAPADDPASNAAATDTTIAPTDATPGTETPQ